MTLLRGALPNVNGVLQRERRRVEPPLRGLLAAGQVRIAKLVGPLRRSGADVGAIDAEVDRERRAGLRDEDGVGAPAAEQRLGRAAGSAEEGELEDAAGDELMPVVEAGERPFAGLVEDVADVLRQVRLGFRRARARRIVLGVRERVADVVGEVVRQPALGLERSRRDRSTCRRTGSR